ncbi:MAG: OB-fold nucleic acid binding domain-containing protein, partial [Bacteroidales bacterium]|nr:OB-fold nucleic acid binding domain-containing protein [Bacteroidales bacterium]
MNSMQRVKVSNALTMAPGQSVLIKGWVRTKRGNKNVAFVALNDGSSIKNIQIVFEASNFSEDDLKGVKTGASIGVYGELVASLGSGQSVEINATSMELYGTADPESYPLQK